MRGRKFCNTHIGGHTQGNTPSTFSSVPKENIFALIEKSKADPHLLDIKEDIAVIDALLKKRLGKTVDEAFSSQLIKEVANLAEKRSQAVARYFKTEKEKVETFNLVQIGYIISCLSEVARKYVEDPKMRRALEKELEEIPYENVIDLQPIQRIS